MTHQDIIDAVEHEMDGNCNVVQDNPSIEYARRVYTLAILREFLLDRKVELNVFIDLYK